MDYDVMKEILDSIPEFYFGANLYDSNEISAAEKVLFNKAPFRYYGNNINYEAKRYEDRCKEFYGVKYAHAVNSGTGALFCAFKALDIKLGDEVIVPGFFWIAISNAIVSNGGIPVLCEIDETYNMSINDLKRKISNKTKCVVAVHMEGTQAEIDSIKEICDSYNIKLLEDFSQCNGGTYKGKKIGSFGDVAISSLQLNKIVTCGEGGIILTNDKKIYDRVVLASDLGCCRENQEFDDVCYGEGRRFNELSAAIMNVQMCKIDDMICQMRKNKYDIMNYLGDIYPLKYRKVVDKEGDTGYSIILCFDSADSTNYFWKIYNAKFPKNNIRFYRLSDTGNHIYYNCTNLVNKKGILGTKLPWCLVDEEQYHYERGNLRETDRLLECAIAVRIPADISELQKKVLASSINYLIREYKESKEEV